jgi:2-methylisocitrate lyase-like PEP mutase family enzyme
MNVHTDPIAAFHRLHSSGCFVMPNPWDAGSARALEQMGFKALATTSASLAWTLGRADNQVTLDQVLKHLQAVVDTVQVPVNADFEGGFAVDPDQVGANVKLAAETGIAGLSIEDSSGDEAHPLFEFELAVERVGAARQAIDESGTGIVLTGRSEGFVCGRPDIDETIRRLRAYAEAGADCLYAPRIDTIEHIAAIVSAVSPTGKPADQCSVHHRCGGGTTGSTADQRWRHARAHRVGWIPEGGEGDRGRGNVLAIQGLTQRRCTAGSA